MVSYEVLESKGEFFNPIRRGDVMPIPANGEYLTRIVRTVYRVLDCGKEKGMFDDEVDGWCTVVAKNGAPILGFRTAPLTPEVTEEFQRQAAAQVQWLRTHEKLTSSRWTGDGTSTAVAVHAYDFFIGYASSCPNRLWNEAIAVVTAIRMYQFNEAVIRDRRWHLRANPCIEHLLEAASWLE